jgi:hypothetical protein
MNQHHVALYSTLLCGILFVPAQGMRAAELTGPVEIGSYRGPTGNTYRQDFENPKEKVGEITGTVKSIDRISGDIWVEDAKGIPVEFALEANTRLQEHHLQISLDDLHLGDRVSVYYNSYPQMVNRIDRM